MIFDAKTLRIQQMLTQISSIPINNKTDQYNCNNYVILYNIDTPP